MRFNRLLENLSGNFLAVLAVDLIQLIKVKISIVRCVSKDEVFLNLKEAGHVLLHALTELLCLVDFWHDGLYEHPVAAQLAGHLRQVLRVSDIFVIRLQSVIILVKMVDLLLESFFGELFAEVFERLEVLGGAKV